MKFRRLVCVLAIAMTAAACGDDGKSPPNDGGPGLLPPDAPDGKTTVAVIPATPNRDLDLLFVIDDSPSMLDKQQNLIDNFPNFINVLNQVPGGLPNLHIGVITTDVGTRAMEDASPGPTIGSVGQGGCTNIGKGGRLQIGTAPISNAQFLSDTADSTGLRTRNYTGTLAEAFGKMAAVGSVGCGFEQPLAALQLALDNNPQNTGFLRDSAMLGVVFLTDEDDCSARHTSLFSPDTTTLGPLQSFRCTRFGVRCATGGTTPDEMNQVGAKDQCTGATGDQHVTDVAPFVTFLKSKKNDASKIAVAAIMGTTEPVSVSLVPPPNSGTPVPTLGHSCQYQGTTNIEVADPPVRLKEFLDAFPGASAFATVCQRDLSEPLALIAQLVSRGAGSPCLSSDVPDPGTCVVTDTTPGSSVVVPKCGATPSPPCWFLEEDAVNCVNNQHMKLVITRDAPPDPATITEMRCTL